MVDHDPQTRHDTAEALRILGIQRVTEVDSADEADTVLGAGRVDVVVVAGERPETRSSEYPRQVLPAPGQEFRVPSILLLVSAGAV